ncbi:MAG: gas vesicle protein GvpG [Pseudomonadota bacterium]
MALLRLLSLPIRGPFDAAMWIAGSVREAAMREYTDPATVKSTLDALERALEAGEITEAQFDAMEEQLLERLELHRREEEGR